jgi:hypothetical protein
LKYNFTSAGPGIDLTQGSADRIRLVFGDISTSNFTPLSLYVSLPPNSSSNGVSLYLGSWDDLILEYPFSTFPVSMSSVQSVTLSIWRNFPGASLVVESITTAAQPLAGDYNRDGMVDSADYSVWRRFAGINTRTNSIFPIASADGNADGRVDSADYIIWRKSVASGSGAGFGVADLVPEPSPLYPALCALILARDPRVRRRGD